MLKLDPEVEGATIAKTKKSKKNQSCVMIVDILKSLLFCAPTAQEGCKPLYTPAKFSSGPREQRIQAFLTDDVWTQIIKFLTPSAVLPIALTCQNMYFSFFDASLPFCNTVWRTFCVRVDSEFIKQYEASSGNKNRDSYKDLFRKKMYMTFDPSPVNTQFTDLFFSEDLCTVRNRRARDAAERWELIRAKRLLVPGYVYEFEFVIDYLDKLDLNVWLVVVGINSAEHHLYTRTSEEEFGPWLTHKANGFGVIAYDGKLIHNDSTTGLLQQSLTRLEYKEDERIVIGFRVDMTQTVDGIGTQIHVFYNGLPYTERPFTDLVGEQFYPAVSLVNQQKVTIRNGLKLTL